MITKPTVFIIGAGASVPYGFPSGISLVESIQELTHKQYYRNFANQHKGQIGSKESDPLSFETIKEFYETFTKAQTSIDYFVSDNPKYKQTAEALIVYILGHCESYAKLFDNEKTQNRTEKMDNWLYILWSNFLRPYNLSLEDFKKNKVWFITYNYDRVLEHYLFNTIKHGFNISAEEAFEVLNSIEIHHIHGSLGKYIYSVEQQLLEKGARRFGEKTNDGYPRALKSFKLMRAENNEDEYAKKILEQAKYINFLGFGYDPHNIEILGIKDMIQKGKIIKGTAYGIPTTRRRFLHKNFAKYANYDTTFPDVTISEFLLEYADLPMELF